VTEFWGSATVVVPGQTCWVRAALPWLTGTAALEEEGTAVTLLFLVSLVFIRMVCEDYQGMNTFLEQKVSFLFLIFLILILESRLNDENSFPHQ
jgi:hypothetical protein